MICLSLEFIKVTWNLGKISWWKEYIHTVWPCIKSYTCTVFLAAHFSFPNFSLFPHNWIANMQCIESIVVGWFFFLLFSLYKKYKDEFQYWSLFCIYYILDNGIRIITWSVLHAGYWSVFWIITEFHLIKIMAAL